MYWVYILRCADDIYYVGETKRLYRRFWEHDAERGGLNTSTFVPLEVIALYKVNMLGKFFEYNSKLPTYNHKFKYFDDITDGTYNSKQIENIITECLMIKDPQKCNSIRGGKYTRFNANYKFPQITQTHTALPFCKCGLPADVRINYDKNHLYFRCAKKNKWQDINEMFMIDEEDREQRAEPCNYFAEYKGDYEQRRAGFKFVNKLALLDELYARAPWLSSFIKTRSNYCLAGCGKEYFRCFNDDADTSYPFIIFKGSQVTLCKDCFIDKFDTLAETKTNTHPELDLS